MFVAVDCCVAATSFDGAGVTTGDLAVGWGEAVAGFAEAGVITVGALGVADFAEWALEREWRIQRIAAPSTITTAK